MWKECKKEVKKAHIVILKGTESQFTVTDRGLGPI